MSHLGIPSIFEKHEGNNMMWDIYSRQLKDRIIWLGAEVNSFTANAIVAQLLYLDTVDKEKDIHLYINSPGGVITSGMAIYDTMNYVAADVSTMCVGQAASMGAFLLGAGAKGKRYILPNAEVMIHQPLGGASGQASDIERTAKHIVKMKTRLNRLMSEHTGQSVEKIDIDTDRDHYMNAAEALEYGIVDKIIEKRDRSLYKDQEE
jgi:ATP-dependent Clp protease protease subunit